MDLLQLEYFQKIAEMSNITQAANYLHISQPALSKSLKSLETELGANLFDRVGKKIRLNRRGEILLKQVEIVFQALENAKKEIEYAMTEQRKPIIIYNQINSPIVIDLVNAYCAQHPKTKFNLTKKQYSASTSKHEYCDFIIAATITPVPSENSMVLFEEELVLGMANNHPLASRGSVSLYEVANEQFISHPRISDTWIMTEQYCKNAGFEQTIVIECSDWQHIRDLVKLGMGIAFFPSRSWFPLEEEDQISFLPISSPRCSRSIVLSWKEETLLSDECIEFRSFAESFL